MSHAESNIWEVTLAGPVTFGPSSLFYSLLPWNQPMWREVTIQMLVGSERCPDWDHVNLCMTAIQEMITMSGGLISDEVLAALQEHLDVIDVRTYKGPPNH